MYCHNEYIYMTYFNVLKQICIKKVKPVANSNFDAAFQSHFQGGTFWRKLLCKWPKGIHHTKRSILKNQSKITVIVFHKINVRQ